MLEKEAKELLKEISKNKYKPNEWERGFLSSIQRTMIAGRGLTPKQCKVLQDLLTKSQGGGTQQPKVRLGTGRS